MAFKGIDQVGLCLLSSAWRLTPYEILKTLDNDAHFGKTSKWDIVLVASNARRLVPVASSAKGWFAGQLGIAQ